MGRLLKEEKVITKKGNEREKNSIGAEKNQVFTILTVSSDSLAKKFV